MTTTIMNHYFDDGHPLHPYSHSAPASPGTLPPANALRGEAPIASPGFHPAEENGAWTQIEDHRGAEGYLNEEPYSIKDFGPLPEGWSADPPPPTPEETAAQETAAAAAQSSAILTARMQRQLVQAEEFTPAEFATFARAGLFPAWTAGETYATGERLAHAGTAYKVQQPVTAQAHQPPGSAGMLAIYRPISADPDTGAEPDGSLDNPYSFISGMDVSTGKYYTFEGKLYLAKADMKPCVWNPGTAGLWQWKLVE